MALRAACSKGSASSLQSSISGKAAVSRSNFLGVPVKSSPKAAAYTRQTRQITAKVSRPEETFYVVRKGDSLYRIAKQHDVTLSSLANANSIRIARRVPIVIGQKLKIPAIKDRATLNRQEKLRLQAKLKRISEGTQLANSKEQLRASLTPRVPADRGSRKDVVASVAVDTRLLPPTRSQDASWWQNAGFFLVLGAAAYLYSKLKPSNKQPDAVLRPIKSSKLKLRPAPPPPNAPRNDPSLVAEVVEDTSALRYTRVGATLFAVGSPRVLEGMLSSNAYLPKEVDVSTMPFQLQDAFDKREARRILEARLAAARAQALDAHRRAEEARARALQLQGVKEKALGRVERIMELSSANEEVLRNAEAVLAGFRPNRDYAASQDKGW